MNIDAGATLIALLTFFGIYGLISLSLNLEYGVAGIPNFGKALFVSIGAYTAGMTYTRLLPLLAGQEAISPCGTTLSMALQLRTTIMRDLPATGFVNFALTIAIAMAVGAVVGYLMSYAALRLKQEWFLALVLLVGGEIVRVVVRGYDPIICASNGVSGIAQPFFFIRDARANSVLFMALILTFLLIAFIYTERLIRSPYGRLLRAVRENDMISQAMGKNVAQIRAGVMAIGSAIAAAAGVLFAMNVGFVSTNDYDVALTLDIWVMVVLGGLGNPRGALIGALMITLLDRFTGIAAIQLNRTGISLEFNYFRYILLGVILLLMLRFRPRGLLPERRDATHAYQTLETRAGNATGDQT